MELCETPIHELHQRRLRGEVSTEEIARSVLNRIQRVEEKVRAYILLTLEGVEAAARQLEISPATLYRYIPGGRSAIRIEDPTNPPTKE